MTILLLISQPACTGAQGITGNAGKKQEHTRIVVAADGTGDHKTIQGALNSLPEKSDVFRVVFIKKGIYREKLYIEKEKVILEGEDRESTIITASVSRDIWRCTHADDWGVATLNVRANDITLKNLTITNSFGFERNRDTLVACPSDTLNGGKKIIRKDGHQMALRTMACSRLKAVNCRFRSYGGDTVSPWNVEEGMWYFKNCIMEGGVDLYCPRGWAWAEQCEFIAHSGSAVIWHDGSRNPDAKSVFINCRFRGFEGFALGRYHRDAQFFLIRCVFAANMADKPVYRVPTENKIQWGERVYYHDCRKENGKDYSWYQNNFPPGLSPEDISVSRVFNNKWSPDKTD
ncbi:MAG: pectinesterase family protein [Chitinophagaceae bacterium]|nr:pectinesterase family protein [Chitinophagaceae bacterium]